MQENQDPSHRESTIISRKLNQRSLTTQETSKLNQTQKNQTLDQTVPSLQIDDKDSINNNRMNIITSVVANQDNESSFIESPQQSSSRRSSFLTGIKKVMAINRFTPKFHKTFTREQIEIYNGLKERIFQMFGDLDENIQAAMERKEYKILKAYKFAIEKITTQMKKIQENNEAVIQDATSQFRFAQILQQMEFFREESYNLSEIGKSLKTNIANLNEKVLLLQQENKSLTQALQASQFDLINVKTYVGSLHKEIVKHNININLIPEQELLKSNTNSPVQNRQSQIILTQNESNPTPVDMQHKKSAHFSSKERPFSIEKENSKKDSTLQLNRKKSVPNTNSDNQYFPQKELNTEIHEVIENALINLNQNEITNQISAFIYESLDEKDKMITEMKQEIFKLRQKNLSSQIYDLKLINYEEKNLKELYIKSVNEVKEEIRKRFGKIEKFDIAEAEELADDQFTKFDKIEVMKRFFASDRFLQLVRIQIFSEQCCNHPNCRNNISQTQDQEREQTNNISELSKMIKSDNIQRQLSSILYNDTDLIKDDSSAEMKLRKLISNTEKLPTNNIFSKRTSAQFINAMNSSYVDGHASQMPVRNYSMDMSAFDIKNNSMLTRQNMHQPSSQQYSRGGSITYIETPENQTIQFKEKQNHILLNEIQRTAHEIHNQNKKYKKYYEEEKEYLQQMEPRVSYMLNELLAQKEKDTEFSQNFNPQIPQIIYQGGKIYEKPKKKSENL